MKDFKSQSGLDPLLNKEAKRVVKAAPKWEPDKYMSKPVKVQYVIPVIFGLH